LEDRDLRALLQAAMSALGVERPATSPASRRLGRGAGVALEHAVHGEMFTRAQVERWTRTWLDGDPTDGRISDG
jgi:hypothetical protein